MGSLYFADAPWPDPGVDLSSLKRYANSPNIDTYSCPMCSSPLFCVSNFSENVPYVIIGALEHASPGLIQYTDHMFVEDTIDGGAATVWLRKGHDGQVIPKWKGRAEGKSEKVPESWPENGRAVGTHEGEASPELTPLWCHCKGVNYLVKRGVDLVGNSSPENPKYVNPSNGKYIASIDACNSCRLIGGADLFAWATIPVDHILFPSSSASSPPSTDLQNLADFKAALASKDPRLGTLTIYNSSEGVERYHCSTCSATVLWTAPGKRPEQLEVAVGLLDHPDGARADGLLAWEYGEVGFKEDTHGSWREELVKSAEKDSESWRSENGYSKDFIRVHREGNN